MLRYAALVLAALIPSLAGPSGAIAESSDTSLRSAQHPSPSSIDNPGGERTTRASKASANQLRPAPTLPKPRLLRNDQLGPASRMVDAEWPDTSRTPETRSPHATDPLAPEQAGTRSAVRDVRAPANPARQRSEPRQISRMTVLDGTRLTHASFEDWLFGR